MTTAPLTVPGTPLDEINTPSLLIELDAFERNLQRMADDVGRYGVRFRPHAKTHKCPTIVHRQMELGAIGCCCQTLHEAEAMVAGGIGNVLISNQVIGARKTARVALLAATAQVGVCVDDAENVAQLNDAAADAGTKINVLVEIDVGMGRCGTTPGRAAVDLACRVRDCGNLHFEGIQAYHGRAQHLRTPDERATAIHRATELTSETLSLLEDEGMSCATVAGAGTGTYRLEASSGVYNELQAGSYIFMDADYAKNDHGSGTGFEHSLFVLSTVISVQPMDRVVVDAGLKAHSVDSGLPVVAGLDDVTYVRPSDEHGSLDLSASSHRFALGDKVRLIPGHCDPTVNLYDWFIGVRQGHVEQCWPITARGPGV